MTCRQTLPRTTGDEDRLWSAFISWRLKQQAAQAAPDCPIATLEADFRWILLGMYAAFAGWSEEHDGALEPWVRKECARHAERLRREREADGLNRWTVLFDGVSAKREAA